MKEGIKLFVLLLYVMGNFGLFYGEMLAIASANINPFFGTGIALFALIAHSFCVLIAGLYPARRAFYREVNP